jgi:hypothetical protein
MRRSFDYTTKTGETYRQALHEAKQDIVAAIAAGSESNTVETRVAAAIATMTVVSVVNIDEKAVCAAVKDEFTHSFLEVDVLIGGVPMRISVGQSGDGGYHPSRIFFNFRAQDKDLFDPVYRRHVLDKVSDAAFPWPFTNADEREYAQMHESDVREQIAKAFMTRVRDSVREFASPSNSQTDLDDDTLHPRYELSIDLARLASGFINDCRV